MHTGSLVKAIQDPLLGEHSLCANETRVQGLDEGENPSSNSQRWVHAVMKSIKSQWLFTTIKRVVVVIAQKRSSGIIKDIYNAVVTVFMTVLKALLLWNFGCTLDVI